MSNICIGSTTQLTGSPIAAILNPWVSSDGSVVTITNSGLVTSITAGTTSIIYTNTFGCKKVVSIIVDPLPTVTGTLTVCPGLTTQLSGSGSPAAANPWVSFNPLIATITSSGLVTGVSTGTTTITYTTSTGCQRTATITVNGGGGISFVSPPPTPTSVGTSGQIALDQNYSYFCISDNNWRRSAIGSWWYYL